MRLSMGERLGRFEIVGCLGVGGMGEVYRARDPQLQRDVAIKILAAGASRDPDRQRRFEQEARAAGGLNHPNIVAVYDVGEHHESTWIVTELLQGETLRQRMDGRPLSPRTAIDYAVQIASGLAAAHERGIVHRDIKPANLFVTTDGRIKILDFGLAKLIGPDAAGDATETITVDGRPVAPVMGTALYMSPEQACGRRTDHRSDIFSFGSVLYEMLAGFPPFRRGSTAETLSAILHDDPPEFGPAVAVHPALGRLVLHCLEKDPVARFQSARDLVFGLETQPSTTASTPARASRRGSWKTLALVAGALGPVSIVAALGYLAGTRTAPIADAAAVDGVRRLTDFRGLEEFPSISPDRKSLAFTANVDGRRQIYVRLLASGGGPPLQITFDPVDHQHPRWSPDSSAIFYFSPAGPGEAQGTIWSVPALRGPARRVISSIGGADVGRNGRVACFILVDGRVQLVTSALDGTDVRAIGRFDAGYHRYPRWSPDSRWIAFLRGDGLRIDAYVLSANGGETRQLTHDHNIMSGLAWLPDSTGVVYGSSRGSTIPYLPHLRLWETRLDGRTTRPITTGEVSYEQPDVHDTGLVAARMQMQFEIWKVPFGPVATANVAQRAAVTRQTGQVLTPTAAPDGERFAFLSDSGGHSNLWVMSTRTGELRQVTSEDDPAVSLGVPAWSPGGGSIAFVSSKGRTGFDFGVWLIDPDGGNLRNLVPRGLGIAWSPDGKWIYYTEDTPGGALKKIEVSGGTPVTVRSEQTRNVIGLSETTLYYLVARPLVDGRPEFEIHAATPEDGPARLVARIPASRVPDWQIINPSLSPDGQWLALPLTDGFTTNIWALSTRTREWRQVTDFGDKATFIARKVSWSPDGKSILAAIGDGDSDIVSLSGDISIGRR